MSRNRYEEHNRSACIVDGDNLTHGGKDTVADVAHVLQRVAMVSDGLPVTFAMQRELAAAYLPAYVGHGWGIRFAAMTPDAADRELLEAAKDYIAHGVRDVLVASGDHAFARLAGHARLHVLTYRLALSNRLRIAATTVTYLDDLLAKPSAA
jgi:hypothetical protein